MRLPAALQQGFLRNVMVLLSGTAIAQVIPMLASIVLTRLFTPAEFGLLGVFTAILTVAAVTIALRYEHAIVIEPEEGAGMGVARTCLAIVGAISIASLAIVALFSDAAARAYGADFARVLWLLPPALLFTGLVQIWSLWLLRHGRFADIARTRIVQSLAITGASIAAGLAGGSGTWLVIATVAGTASGTLWLLFVTREPLPVPFVRLAPMKGVLKRFRRFPMYTVPADLLSAGAAQLPMLFLASGYGTAAAGAFLLTQRVLGAPLSVVGSAVMDAYKRDAAVNYEAGSCRPLTWRTMRHLALLSLVPWLLAVTISPWVFELVFGADWRQAGVLCQLLATPLFLRFITTPVSYNFYLAGRQSEDLVAQIYNLASNAFLLWFVDRSGFGVTAAVGAYAANLTLVYAFYLWRSLALADNPAAKPA